MNDLERLQSHYRMYSWIKEQLQKHYIFDEDGERNDWQILDCSYPEILTFIEDLISNLEEFTKEEYIYITAKNQYTEELINGMLLILKHQPDARHDLTTSYGTFIFGSADIDMGEEDETQLAMWKWEVFEDLIEGKKYWAYSY